MNKPGLRSLYAWMLSAALGVVAAAGATIGCSGAFLYNLTEQLDGNVSVVVINNTPFRASFSIGAWDSLNRNPPGSIAVEQRRIEANQSSTFTLACRRQIAIGTDEMIERAIDNDFFNDDEFDAEAFVAVVNFSSADVDSDAAALPTAGTAEGLEVQVGEHYNCQSQLIFTFEQDAAQPGGFGIKYDVATP